MEETRRIAAEADQSRRKGHRAGVEAPSARSMRRASESAAVIAHRREARSPRHRQGGRLPLKTEREIRQLCMGYRHRARRIEDGRLPTDILSDMKRTNALIDDALEETCEPGLRPLILSDLADRRGTMYTQAYFIGEVAYKRRKQAAKHAIARRFGLPTRE